MTHSFNLIDEPFVPCLRPDGTRIELGLRNVFAQAHELREIRDDSPIVTMTLHRLLLAILHINFGPKDMDQWRTIWEVGRFDMGVLNTYFDEWHKRFDLFHPEWPFYQSVGGTQNPRPTMTLYEELAGGNNPTLFDHSTEEREPGVMPALAARGLIARQAFALGLGVSPTWTVGDRDIKTGNQKDGPIARGILLLVRGDDLFQTLTLNLSPPDEPGAADDRPVWEHDSPGELMDQPVPAGRLDLYTFQCRRIRLEPPGDDGLIRRVHFAQGRILTDDQFDPMKAYRRDEERGWCTIGLQEERALWRDSASLLQLAHHRGRQDHRPVNAVEWIAEAALDGVVSPGARFRLDAAGVGTQAGKARSVGLWRQEQLPLPVGYLHDAALLGNLQSALSTAETVGRNLRESVWHCARKFLHPAKTDKLSNQQNQEVTAMVESLAPLRHYWPHLETPFFNLLQTLPALRDTSTEQDHAHRRAQLSHWFHDVLRPTARQAYETTAGRMDNTSRALRAVVLGRQNLERALGGIASQPPFNESPGQPAPDTEETADVATES
jgi:CRISPR system Cascade subunit CasA